MPKRRVFISYHHANEQDIVDAFSKRFSEEYEVFTDRSIERAADSDDVDYLAQVCREQILGTSVTIVMVGERTGQRKFVDWEIRYTLEKQHGLVAVLRPGLASEYASLPDRVSDNRKTGYAKYYNYPDSPEALRSIIDEAYNADKSLIDNSRPKRVRNG